MIRLFLIIFFSFFSINHIQAKGCKRVNLLTRKWGMFPRQMPLYDQGRSHICYAYTAAQMLDYWRETHGGKIGKMKMGQSSPLYAALLTRLVYAPSDRYKNSFKRVQGKNERVDLVCMFCICRSSVTAGLVQGPGTYFG